MTLSSSRSAIGLHAMDGRIHKVVRLISQDLGRDWTVEFMAEMTGLSVEYFSKLFKNVTRSAPLTFLRTARMTAAAEQLSDPDNVLSIKQIARLVGCPDASHFTKDFKEHFGVTPTQFRKKEAEKF